MENISGTAGSAHLRQAEFYFPPSQEEQKVVLFAAYVAPYPN